MCYTGFRISEYLSLTSDMLHEHDGHYYFIAGAKTEAGIDRIVPVNHKVLPFVLERIKSGRLCGKPDGAQMRSEYFRKNLYYPALKSLRIAPKSPHATRHTFATMMKDVDVSTYDKMSVIGHSSIEMTKHYTHTNIDSLIKLVEGLSM